MKQENLDLVIPSAAIERLVEYKSRLKQCYQLHTTGIIKHACSVPILDLSSVSISSFNGKEMERFLEFFYDNSTILQAIGFNDSSALFYALSNHYSIVVIDDVTEIICNQLNVKTVRIEEVQDILNLENRDTYILPVENGTCNSQMNLSSQSGISSINKRRFMTG